MSRKQAVETVRVRDLRQQMCGVAFDERNARRLTDQAPVAYRPISAVMKAQKDLVRVERRLLPVLNYKDVLR